MAIVPHQPFYDGLCLVRDVELDEMVRLHPSVGLRAYIPDMGAALTEVDFGHVDEVDAPEVVR